MWVKLLTWIITKWFTFGQNPPPTPEIGWEFQSSQVFSAKVLCFRNSCQFRLCLCLSCDYLSTNSILRCMTVGYHIIFVPLFTWTFLWDSLSYSQVLPYVTTIWSSSVDINSDSLLYISTLDFAFQGMGMLLYIIFVKFFYQLSWHSNSAPDITSLLTDYSSTCYTFCIYTYFQLQVFF